MAAVLKPQNRPSNPRYQREWFEDISVSFEGRTAYLSVEAEHTTDMDGNPIVGTIYYDGKPISAIPVLVNLIELALQDEE